MPVSKSIVMRTGVLFLISSGCNLKKLLYISAAEFKGLLLNKDQSIRADLEKLKPEKSVFSSGNMRYLKQIVV